MTDFQGLVAAVTGGGSGIGAAVADLLAVRGARVAVLDREPGAGGAHLRLTADVTAPLEQTMDRVAATLGGLDVLVNCAAVSAVGAVEAADDAEWHRCLDVNVVGVARACRAALPHLRRSTSAAIVSITSIAATAGLVDRAVYSATKGAVHALSLAMAADLVGDGIRVCTVAPGTVDTPWVARLLAGAQDPATEKRRLAARQPTGRLVTADEVAQAVAFLASPVSGATTGTALAVDGGMSGLRLVR
ncbi:SDR family oxidoreductase [Micromonospora wenchangensis]|uniref:Short-chain dehydrogenase n=1 Tax=Micromonospora wenchangensis TaxID=1185415 RepID=A0A246RF51_9ACTN|nr:SDR family oxidoreductase [Micromonospora wenchangensis]OWV00910.1 short-chain dehydrogenase [Micromonospora wenchangensis]